MSARTEILYEPDNNIDIEEFKLEPIDSHSADELLVKEETLDIYCDISKYDDIKQEPKDFDQHFKREELVHDPLKPGANIDIHKFKSEPVDPEFFPEYLAKEEPDESYHDTSVFESNKCGKQDPAEQMQRVAIVHEPERNLGILETNLVPEQERNQKLSQHKISKSSFSCDICEFVTHWKANLHKHKRSIHEGIRYPCNQCQAGDASTYTA